MALKTSIGCKLGHKEAVVSLSNSCCWTLCSKVKSVKLYRQRDSLQVDIRYNYVSANVFLFLVALIRLVKETVLSFVTKMQSFY